MGYIHTNEDGISLRQIIEKLGNKNYPYICCRCKWTEPNGEDFDEFFGACAYEGGKLESLDGDTYSLDDLYVDWEEWVDTSEDYGDNGAICLTVWEAGRHSEGR